MCLNVWARDASSRVNPKEDIALAQQTWGQYSSVCEVGMKQEWEGVVAQNDSEKKPGPWSCSAIGKSLNSGLPWITGLVASIAFLQPLPVTPYLHANATLVFVCLIGTLCWHMCILDLVLCEFHS